MLTGESVPVIKTLPALPAPEDKDQDVAVGDRTNMAFRQTSVAQGSGKGAWACAIQVCVSVFMCIGDRKEREI